MREPVGQIFPAGGPVPPELVIGRRNEIESLLIHLRERVSVLVTGERRVGKTTLCDAACFEAELNDGALIVKVEVPERPGGTTADLLQAIGQACEHAGHSGERRKLFRAARPLLEQILREHDLPLDLRELGADADPTTSRRVILLPLALAKATKQPTVFYLDELQRITEYEDGAAFVSDLVDVYSNNPENTHVTVLVDGSDERAVELLTHELRLGKLCKQFELGPTIHETEWRPGLREHFQRAGLEIDPDVLELLVKSFGGRPYPTMLAARNSGMNAREMKSDRVESGDVEYGIDETRKRLRDEPN